MSSVELNVCAYRSYRSDICMNEVLTDGIGSLGSMSQGRSADFRQKHKHMPSSQEQMWSEVKICYRYSVEIPVYCHQCRLWLLDKPLMGQLQKMTSKNAVAGSLYRMITHKIIICP